MKTKRESLGDSQAKPTTPSVHPPESRTKVDSILPYAERFTALERRDRWSARIHQRKPSAKRERQQWSAKLAAQFKACRLDKPFAYVALRKAISALPGSVTSVIYGADSLVRASLGFGQRHQQWDRPEHIEESLWISACAHRALSDPTKVACYPTRNDAKRGREVVMAAGRFFAQTNPDWSPARVQAQAEAFSLAGKPIEVEFIGNDDPDGWAQAYSSSRGFTSCMSGDWSEDDPNNPARFYAYPGNGLALAVLRAPDDDDAVVARCIVNTERMLAVRVYGDSRLGRALIALGYGLGQEAARYDAKQVWPEVSSEWALKGVKCARIVHRGRIVGPWVDGHTWASDCGDHVLIGNGGSLDLDQTTGYLDDDDESAQCHDCGDEYDEDDMTMTSSENYVCPSCLDHGYTYAIATSYGPGMGNVEREYVPNEDTVETSDGESFRDSSRLLRNCGYVLDVDHKWRPEDECVFLEYLGEYVDFDNCTQLDVNTPEGDSWAQDGDTITITLNGEELTVHEGYDGPTDEKLAQQRKQARTAARAAARRKLRRFSRGPGRRNHCLSCRRQRLFARTLTTAAQGE